MKLRVLCILSVVLALGLIGGLAAQTNNYQPSTNNANANPNTDQPQAMATSTATGTVVSSDNSSLVIDTGNGRQTFMVDTSSTVPTGLTPGTRVSVQFHTLSGDRFHAATVTTLAGAPTTGTETNTAPVENPPAAPTGSANMGSTDNISGTVVSSTPTVLVIETPSGPRRFMVDAQSTLPSSLAKGATVSVDYHTLPGNRFHAATVIVSSAPMASGTVTEQTTTTQSTTTTETTTPKRTTRTARNLGPTGGGPESGRRASLPATAGELPLVGLIGLFSLIAAFGLRTLSRRSA